MNTRIALVGVETWNDTDRVTVDSSLFVTLERFADYRRSELLTRFQGHDNAQLLSYVYTTFVLIKLKNKLAHLCDALLVGMSTLLIWWDWLFIVAYAAMVRQLVSFRYRALRHDVNECLL